MCKVQECQLRDKRWPFVRGAVCVSQGEKMCELAGQNNRNKMLDRPPIKNESVPHMLSPEVGPCTRTGRAKGGIEATSRAESFAHIR
jgi:hypothetical protein